MDLNIEKIKRIQLIQYIGWDDHRVPEHTNGVLKLFDLINEHRKKHDNEFGPLAVHCAAGIGRTGTFIALHILIERMKAHKQQLKSENYFDFNIYNVVKELKRHRIGMVQQKEQYTWLYRVIYEEAKKYDLVALPSVNPNVVKQ